MDRRFLPSYCYSLCPQIFMISLYKIQATNAMTNRLVHMAGIISVRDTTTTSIRKAKNILKVFLLNKWRFVLRGN